ncbi:MAG: hypothetical protein HRT38_12175 [Alteromonadaceae bacterium]|nr:hypothetical protein [Alteromonadaceae bacterium]
MHYDEQREKDSANNRAKKIKATLPYSSSENKHLNITWHLGGIVKTVCVDWVKKSKVSI